MNYLTQALRHRNLRAIISAFISYLMLAGQVAPLALAASGPAARLAPVAHVDASSPSASVNFAPAPAPLVLAPNITATKTDSFPSHPSGKAQPGDIITYSVTVTNTGTDATNVTLNDTVDPNTTIVAGSAHATPIAQNESFNVLGNVRIQVPDGASDLLANDVNPDTGTNAGLTASGPTTGPSHGQATVAADGSFTYNPAPGYEGPDSFTYTVTSANGSTTATANLTVTGMIWFVNATAPAGGDGRLTNPFNCLVGAGCFDPAAADDIGDNIFLFSGNYTGGLTLLNNQKLIGQGASATLQVISGVTVPPNSDALPSTAGANPVVTTAGAINGVTLGQGNTLRGFTIGNTGGAKILGSNFGTLTVGNNAAPDMTLNGTGQALNLATGTFAATSGFSSVTSTSSGTQGIVMTPNVAGTVSFGSTTISGSTTQGILLSGSTVTINFGNTSVTGGTDAISLQNNSSGTRTFGTITTLNNSGVGFLHGGGGGTTTAGATTITNPGGRGIDIQNSTTQVTFGNTNVSSSAGTGIFLNTNGGGVTFADLDIAPDAGQRALLAQNNTGTITSTSGSIIASGTTTFEITGASAAARTPLSMALDSISGTNSTGVDVNLNFVSGNLAVTTTTISNPAGIGIQVQNSGAGTLGFGNTNVSSSAGTGIFLNTNGGGVTFADLDIAPDAGQRALLAQNNTGTITSTSGTVTTTANVVLEITGASAAARTPLSMTLDDLSSTNSPARGVVLNFVSGNLTVVGAGTDTDIQNPTGIGIDVQNTGAGTINFGDTTVNGSGSTSVQLGTASNGNTGNVTFGSLDLSPDSGQRALLATQDTGTITSTSGAVVTTNNTAVEIQGTSNASRTPLNMQFTSVNVAGGSVAPDGIFLNNTSASGSPGGFKVLGNGGSCTLATPTCTGGRIQLTSGADGATGGTGVRMANADSVSFTLMRLNDHPNFAVYGTNVNGFTLTNSFIHGVNGTNAAVGTEEGSVSFDNLLGSATISSTDIDGGKRDNLRVVNTSGTLNRLTVSNTIIRFHDAATGNDALHFEGFNAGTTMNLTVTGSTFKGARGDMIEATAQTGVTEDVVIRSNSFTNEQANVVSGNTAIIVQGSGTMTYDISCNKVQQVNAAGTVGTAQGHGINVAKSTAGGNFSGTVFNNTIGKPGVQSSGAGTAGSGINFISNGTGTHTALIKNNFIRNYGESGIRATGNNGNSTANITIVGNVTTEPHPTFGFAGLFVDVGAFASDSNTFNVKVGGAGAEQNDFTLGTPVDPGDISLNETAASTNTHLNLTRPPSASNVVDTVLQDNNTGTPTTNNSGTITLVNTTPTLPAAIDETCTPPAGPEVFVEPITPGGIGSQSGDSLSALGTPTSDSVTSRPFVSLPNRVRQIAPTTVATAPLVRSQPAPAAQPARTTTQTAQADTVTPNPPVIVGDNLTWNIGTLPAGKSVTITFQVTVDDPYAGGPNVSNQGTVTADGGISVQTDDPDVTGANNPTLTPIASLNITARDGKAPEPPSGTSPLLFTVTLSAPATGGGVTVNYATADGGATPATGGATCGTAGVDYETTSGTLTFASGERVKTVSVNICSDATVEPDETFLLNLSNAVGGTITGATATGTITAANPAGTFLISELRTSGPAGAGDDFVELYNNTNTQLTVPAGGFGVFKMGTDCNATPVLIGTVPAATIIPARGHYLLVGSQYSLGSYAAGNQTLTSDIETDRNVAVFSTTDVALLSTTTRLDAVGFDGNTGGGVCDLLREGTTLPPISAISATEHSFFRKECDFVAGVGCTTAGTPKDVNVNATDFQFADTQGTFLAGEQHLGAPGPENLTSPIERGATVNITLLDNSKSSSVAPNRVRDFTSNPGNNSSNGTLSIRRRVVNNSGANVTRLRFRIVEITTFPTPGGGVADLRALSSTSASVSGVTDPNTCLASTGSATTPCMVTVQGTTLEQPPNQINGGGYNSTMAAGTITTGTPLAPGASINLQFLLGLQTTGSFRFTIIVEALP